MGIIHREMLFKTIAALAVIGLVSARRGGSGGSGSTAATTAATTTTTASGGDGTSSGLYGPTVAALTTKSSVEYLSDYCGSDATGYYEEYVDGDTRYVIISGAPSHDAEYDQEHANPNTRCERWQYAALPLTWSDSGSNTQQMGATGFVTSGGVVYDHRSSPTGDLASYYEWDSLDPSFGHSNNVNQYHYHAVPTEWSSSADPSACEHIGYMIDGAKLYGYCEVNGAQVESCYVQVSSGTPTHEDDYEYTASSSCLLDNCNMMEINGEMAYVITPNYPYVPPCLKGVAADIYGFTPDDLL